MALKCEYITSHNCELPIQNQHVSEPFQTNRKVPDCNILKIRI